MTHPLDGPRLKIRRAKSEIDALRRAEETFRAQAEYEIIRGKLNPQTGKYPYRVRVNAQPSLDEWGVFIGEIAHNLRSALDGLVYQLVRLNGQTATLTTQFPIFLHRNGHRLPGGHWEYHGFEGRERGSGREMIRLIRPDHQALIERVQPYHRWGLRKGGRRHSLYILKEINNADKHRLIQVVGVVSGIGPAVSHWGESPSQKVDFSRRKILKDGAIRLHAPPDVHMNARLIPLIAFAEAPARGRGACLLLRTMAEEVSQIVECFGPEFP